MRAPRVWLFAMAIGLGALAIAFIALASHRDELPAPPATVPIGAHVPQLKLADASREVTLIDEIRGQPAIVVVFLGSWCPYCRNELERLKEAVDHRRPEGITILGASPDPPEALAALGHELGLPFALLTDRGQNVSALCRFAMHCVLLFDGAGTLRWAGYAESWQAPVDYERVIHAGQHLR